MGCGTSAYEDLEVTGNNFRGKKKNEREFERERGTERLRECVYE